MLINRQTSLIYLYILNTLTTGRWLLDNLPLGSGGVRLSELCLMGLVGPAVEELLWLWWRECGCTVEFVTEVGSVPLEKLPQLKGKFVILKKEVEQLSV